MMNDYSQIKQVIYVLENDFTLSTNPNTRKGGLVGLAAISIALGRVSRKCNSIVAGKQLTSRQRMF